MAVEFGKQPRLLAFRQFSAGEALELDFGFCGGFLQFAAFDLAFGALEELCQDLECIHNRLFPERLRTAGTILHDWVIKSSPGTFRRDRRNPASSIPARDRAF